MKEAISVFLLIFSAFALTALKSVEIHIGVGEKPAHSQPIYNPCGD